MAAERFADHARRSVNWDGQPVAVVVAETLEQAEHAASLVEIEYRAEKPAASFDAMKPERRGPTMSWASPPLLNRRCGKSHPGGGCDASIAFTGRRDTTTMRSSRTPPLHFGTRMAALTVLESSQSVNTAARTLAYIFGLDRKMFKCSLRFSAAVSAARVGWSNTPLCAAAAKVVKRPVKLALSREGVYRVVGGSTISEQRVALGAARDGQVERPDPYLY